MRDRLRLAAAGIPQAVLLTGEPGIGKTRLSVAVQEDAERSGFTALVGHGYEGVRDPLLLFRESVLPALGPPATITEPGDAAAATRVVLELADRILEAARHHPLSSCSMTSTGRTAARSHSSDI